LISYFESSFSFLIVRLESINVTIMEFIDIIKIVVAYIL
jgi:hypothetical protein